MQQRQGRCRSGPPPAPEVKSIPTILLPLVALALALAVGAPSAAAQVSTPLPLPATPEPAECRVEPRPVEFFVAVFEETMASPEAPLPVDREGGGTYTPTPLPLPGGQSQPADEATVAGVTETMREFIACVNAGDFRRSLALFADEAARGGLRFLWSNIGPIARAEDRATPMAELVREVEASFARPAEPLPADQRLALVEVRDVRIYPDGRVVAEVVGRGIGAGDRGSGSFIFAQEGGRWRIAGAVDASGAGTPVARIPAR